MRTRLDLSGLALLALLGFAWEELVDGRVRYEFEKGEGREALETYCWVNVGHNTSLRDDDVSEELVQPGESSQ